MALKEGWLDYRGDLVVRLHALPEAKPLVVQPSLVFTGKTTNGGVERGTSALHSFYLQLFNVVGSRCSTRLEKERGKSRLSTPYCVASFSTTFAAETAEAPSTR